MNFRYALRKKVLAKASNLFWLRQSLLVLICLSFVAGHGRANNGRANNGWDDGGGQIILTTVSGDKLTGKFVSVSAERIEIETMYAGIISVRSAEVKSWQTNDATLRQQIAVLLPLAVVPDKLAAKVTPHPVISAATSVALKESATESAQTDKKTGLVGKPIKSETWQRSVNLAYALSRGNVNTSDFNASLGLARKHGSRRVAFNSLGRYSVRNGAQVAHLFTANLRYERTVAKLPAFTETILEIDRIKKLDYRLSENIGLTYPVIKKDGQNLSVDFGTGLTREVYDQSVLANPAHNQAVSFNPESLKATSLLRAKAEQKILGKAQFSQQVSLFSDLVNPDNYRMQTDISLTMPITRYLGFRLSGLNRFDNRPVTANVKQNDFSLLTGFNINF